MKSEKKGLAIFILAFLFFSNVLAWLAVFYFQEFPFLEVVFFDVGQGDSIFITTPEKDQILIDGGPDSSLLKKINREMPFFDRTIELLILTHPEKDHLTGLIDVLKKYQVKNIIWTGVIRESPEFEEWQRAITKEKANIFFAHQGRKVSTSSFSLEILYPFENLNGKTFQKSNQTSIVARLNFEEIDFLFTGDIFQKEEKLLLEKGINIQSEILKVAHHGSKTSTSEDFLLKVKPQVVVISTAKNNPYGHPHQEILELLSKYGIKVLRTDQQGDIKIISDGKKYKISTN